ncbi:hypothetical protein XENOCAPTIV_009792 [Xenoophorus captivus]|uniref:Fringe-like glycosyltransferase domain-containing protein n=1 Tax=Xenoophorus captivus TaxID=1517983 RepID=A0ABV0QLM5_9TELE
MISPPQPVTEEADGEDAAARSVPEDSARLAQDKKGFSTYFTKLTRGRREAEKPARTSAAASEPPPAEDISAADIFIAVKTTKKFHLSRLNLLLETWISRNMQQVNTFRFFFPFHTNQFVTANRVSDNL